MGSGTRLIDAGEVDPVTSQALYHAVTRSVATTDQDDTVILARPAAPYVSLGYHYSSAVVDLEYCDEESLPVFRRQIGGGLVYLDRDQLFVQFCVKGLPRYRGAAYERFMTPLVETLDELGLDGDLSDGFDLTANGRKIGGIGAGEIDGASAVTTGLLFDFDWQRATDIHDTPTPAFRRQLLSTMRSRVTTLARECSQRPAWEYVKTRLWEHLMADLSTTYQGALTTHERDLLEEERERLRSDEFLHLIDQPPTERRVKVTDGVFLRLVRAPEETDYTQVVIEERDQTVADVRTLDGGQPPGASDLRGESVEAAVDQLTES